MNKITIKNYNVYDQADQIICPYCDHRQTDDVGDDDMMLEWQCDRCENFFMVWIQHCVNYSSRRLDCKNGISDHQWSDWEKYLLKNGDEIHSRYCTACREHDGKTYIGGLKNDQFET